MNLVPLSLGVCAGIAVAAAAGLRAFLPLLVVGLAARFGGFELTPGMRWLASDGALIAFGTAAALEIAGDKIPVLDHVLDVIATVVRPAAAAVATYGVLAHWPTPWAQIIALLLAGTAFGVHAVKAKTRLGSTAFTGGLANPWLSIFEDVSSLALLALAIVVPLVAGLLAIALVVMLVRLVRSRRRRRATAVSPSATP